jgi:predicted nucleic acid-binding protein
MTALDTNILIYACDKADPKRQQTALDLVSSASDGVLLWQVACEFIAASRKLRSQGFTEVDAWDRLAEYMANLSARPAVSRSVCACPHFPY